ncbi:metal ABC transporter substrate-binding protein [Sulfurisoma sediminicola]|uniref:metal ABC transporter substrate-binding protein n=1 Tax=Sulfurisoma sediminicola TaxID=1381557 RepID=UPI001FB3280B|nr:zinc ABC transporter substrate-binding protein [Sulfurisoma sediminicola]
MLVGGVLAVLAAPALAALNIFATVPEWAALAQEIGGDRVKVFAATHALQDPHRIEAKPSLIARARSADLVVATGAELEVGWLPLVLRESGNARIQPGRPGHFEAARLVVMLEVPARLDRADGDVHAEGNPHIQTDPRNILKVAEALASRMAELDAANAAAFRDGLKAFAQRWQANLARWEKAAAPLKGQPVVVQHKSLTYLLHWLGLREVATLEPRPGVEASAGQLGELLQRVRKQPPRLVLRAAYEAPRAAEWFAGEAKVPLVILPFTVGGDEAARDLTTLFDDTVARLLQGLK